MQLKIDLYGALREADARGYVELEVPEASSVAALRSLLLTHLAASAPEVPAALVSASVFASHDAILHDSTQLTAGATLAVLPPVSGG